MNTYPINLVLQDRLVILIGAKGEITHKIRGLLDVNARIRVIAPSADPTIELHAEAGELEWLQRAYQPGDLTGAALVIAMTNNPMVHDQIWAEGNANGQLVNVMDVLHQCNFHGASLLRRGLLTIAIGTGGAAPALAVTLRKRFEREFGPEYAHFLERTQALRPVVGQQLPRFQDRVRFWYELVESEALTLLSQGQFDECDAFIDRLLADHKIEANGVKPALVI